MTEELALDQAFRDRAAVDGDERPVGAHALGVNGTRRDFFAGAALAFEKHGDVARRRAAEQMHGATNRSRGADDGRESLAPAKLGGEALDLGPKRALRDRVLHRRDETRAIERLL